MKVHKGFQKTFGYTSDNVLSGVQKALKSTDVNRLLVTGHSLGMIESFNCLSHMKY